MVEKEDIEYLKKHYTNDQLREMRRKAGVFLGSSERIIPLMKELCKEEFKVFYCKNLFSDFEHGMPFGGVERAMLMNFNNNLKRLPDDLFENWLMDILCYMILIRDKLRSTIIPTLDTATHEKEQETETN